MTIILAFGTSTTYGAWDIEGGWVQRLRKYLDEKQLKNKDLYYIIYNLGISGDTSEGILKRFESETKQRLESEEEVVILISVGANDAMYNNKTEKHMVSLENFSKNVQSIIDLAKKYSAKIVFLGNKPVDESKVDPIPWLKDCSYKSIFIEEYDKSISRLCKKNNLLFLDLYNIFKKRDSYKELFVDGVHPSTEGHKFVFDIVKDFLIKEKVI